VQEAIGAMREPPDAAPIPVVSGIPYRMVGSPSPIGGDPTAPMNKSHRGQGRTPEMANGMIATQGPSPTSTIISFDSMGTGQNGQPEARFASHPLPKVGTSLMTGTQISDIKVG
jgi:hypothetical protein